MTTTKTLAAIILMLITNAANAAPTAFRTKFPRKLIKGQQVLVCKRVEVPPKIDGEVDRDQVWRTCDYTKSAWVELGTRKQISGRQTVVYTCFDEKNIYFGFVCEETDLSRVQVSGDLKEADSVEVVLEIGGLMGDGHVFSYKANTQRRKQIMGRHRKEVPWRSAGKFGPNRWMVEMAIPFSSLKRQYSKKSVSDPQRGDLIGIKFARSGKFLKSGEPRMISTYNSQLPFRYLYLCGYNHLLYFEDSNVLEDGDFSAQQDRSAWQVKGKSSRVGQGITLDKGAILTQTVKVRKQNSYSVNIDQAGKGSFRILAAKQEVKLNKNRTGSFWNKDRDTVVLTLEALSPVTLRSVNLRYEPGIEPPGPWCLTNNYKKPGRNIRNMLPKAPDGQYRYVKLDYADRYAGDDNPAIPIKVRSWAWKYELRVEDVGGRKGWIPFSKGSLTGRPEPIFWKTIAGNPITHLGWGRHPKTVIEVDLGQEYFVTGFDMHWPAPYMLNAEIWGKKNEADLWTLLHVADGEFVAPAKRKHGARGFDQAWALDSVVRYLRWRGTGYYPKWPELDGMQEFWVWGKPRGDRTGMNVFKPWIADKKRPPVKAETWTPDREKAQIIPAPRNLTREKGRFFVRPDTRIIYQDEPEARKIAGQIQKEIRERWRIELQMVKEQDAGIEQKRFIYLGQPRLGEAAKKMADRADLKLNLSPQGYGLKVQPESVIVLGHDSEGLYYGVQSLMMAMQWYQSRDKSKCGPSAQCMKIIDWPGTLERTVGSSNAANPPLFMLPVSEIGRLKRIFHLLSRFKYNVMYTPGALIGEGQNWTGTSYSWPKGTLATFCREVRDEYHIEIRPTTLTAYYKGGLWYTRLMRGPEEWDAAEFDPDESARNVGTDMNLCPLDPKAYEIIFAKFDQILEQFAWPSQMRMREQIYFTIPQGARWGVCRRCQRSNKTQAELYRYFLHRIAGHLKKRGARGLLLDELLSYGPVRRSPDRVDIRDLPGNLRINLKAFKSKLSDKDKAVATDYLKSAVPAELVVNGPEGWPSRERGAGGCGNIQGFLHGMCGGFNCYSSWPVIKSKMATGLEAIWYAPDSPPDAKIDYANLAVRLNSWWYQRDFPGWRHGQEPEYHPIDLRPFVNHLSHPTGTEVLEAGRAQEIDLRYLPVGKQTLGGIEFDIIDPAQNNGKAILMLGRPLANTHPKTLAAISETAGPIPINRKLASLAFLRTRWGSTIGSFEKSGGWKWWLRPTCCVVYDDDSWLVVDAFNYPTDAALRGAWINTHDVGLYCRLGWLGNAPTSETAALTVVEWVNPHPERTIKHLDFLTPDMNDRRGKRRNPLVEAIIAITGVGVTEQDVHFWKGEKDRSPRLPAREGVPRKRIELADKEHIRIRDSKWKGTLSCRDTKISYSARMMKDTAYYAYGCYRGVAIRKGFFPFGVTLTFSRPINLDSVDLLGPIHEGKQNKIWGAGQRTQKVDVTVEYSEDGKSWKQAGELKGISAEADFLPVVLPRTPMKGLRLTGTGAPYRQHFQQNSKWGLLGHVYQSPHFAWRLFGKKKKLGGTKDMSAEERDLKGQMELLQNAVGTKKEIQALKVYMANHEQYYKEVMDQVRKEGEEYQSREPEIKPKIELYTNQQPITIFERSPVVLCGNTTQDELIDCWREQLRQTLKAILALLGGDRKDIGATKFMWYEENRPGRFEFYRALHTSYLLRELHKLANILTAPPKVQKVSPGDLILGNELSKDLSLWQVYGKGKVQIKDNVRQTQGTPYSWTKSSLPDGCLIRFDFKPEPGRVSLIFGVAGNPVEGLDFSVSASDDMHKHVPSGHKDDMEPYSHGIHAYHVSVHVKHRGTSHMRRVGTGLRMLSYVNHDPCSDSDRTYRIEILKTKETVQFLVDGKLLHAYVDAGAYGPVLGQGHFGIKPYTGGLPDTIKPANPLVHYSNFEIRKVENFTVPLAPPAGSLY